MKKGIRPLAAVAAVDLRGGGQEGIVGRLRRGPRQVVPEAAAADPGAVDVHAAGTRGHALSIGRNACRWGYGTVICTVAVSGRAGSVAGTNRTP